MLGRDQGQVDTMTESNLISDRAAGLLCDVNSAHVVEAVANYDHAEAAKR